MNILFLGDSVTDAHHSTSNDPLGNGYVSMIHNYLHCTYHDKSFSTINSGFNGHRSKDLLNRIDNLLEQKFNYIFVLIGVNDSWRKFDHFDETPVEQYESNVNKLLSIIKEKSDAKTIMLSPFVLPINELTKNIQEDLLPKQLAYESLAKKYNLEFVNLQQVFNRYCSFLPPTDLAKDGIHPTILGHSIIATEVQKIIERDF